MAMNLHSANAPRRLIERVEGLRRARPDRAWRVLERDFARAARGADPAERGELWRLRGHVLRSLRRASQAVGAYRRAEGWYARAGSTRERGRCAIGLVDALMYLGRYDEAGRVAARGRRLLERAGDRVSLGRLLGNEANLHHRLDLPERALEGYREARRALTRAGDTLTADLIGVNVGNCLSLLGRCDEARPHYEDARLAAEASDRPLDALRASYNLAYLEFLEQRHEAALESLERVGAEAAARGYPSIAALAHLDRAEILLRLGAWEESQTEARAAIQRCGTLGLGYERSKAETFAALADYHLGRTASAAAGLGRAIESFHREGNAVWTGEALVGLATLWWHERQPLAAAALLRAAALHFERAGDREREGCARSLLARAQVAAGRLAAAAATLRRLETRLTRRSSPRLTHLALAARASLARSRGDAGAAREALRLAARESERLAARILDEQWRASFWGEWGWPHRALASLELSEGRVAEALEALEAGRGRALLGGQASLRPPRGLGARVREWAVSHEARDRERRSRAGAPLPAAQGGALPPAVERALARRPPSRVSADGIRRSLPKGTLLIDYLLDEESLGAIGVTRGGLRARARLIPAARLGPLVHALLFTLRSAAFAPGARAGDALSRELERLAAFALWPMLEGAPWPRALAVAPVGPLARVPWAALPLPDGRRLAEAMSATLVPGLRLGLSRRAPRVAQGPPLLIAAPGDDLEHVMAEVEEIRSAFPEARVLAGDDATVQRFLEFAPEAGWIHFAGHGIYQSAAPQLSGLRFADRWLAADELASRPLAARWVTLSACQTARALVRPGEEWFGLARTLLMAGAGSVIASQWDVEDRAARTFMALLYPRLAAGEPLAAGLARTQAELAGSGLHPIDWAGFVHLGGPEATHA